MAEQITKFPMASIYSVCLLVWWWKKKSKVRPKVAYIDIKLIFEEVISYPLYIIQWYLNKISLLITYQSWIVRLIIEIVKKKSIWWKVDRSSNIWLMICNLFLGDCSGHHPLSIQVKQQQFLIIFVQTRIYERPVFFLQRSYITGYPICSYSESQM